MLPSSRLLRSAPVVHVLMVLALAQRAHAADDGSWSVIRSAASQIADRCAVDEAGQRVYRFGGRHEVYVNTVSRLTLTPSPLWTDIPASGTAPAGREEETLIYDSGRNQLIVFGGRTGATFLGDVWKLSLTGTPTWQQLSPAGSPPSARSGHAAIYDPVRQRMIVIGGQDAAGFKSDCWALDLAAPTPAWSVLPSGPAASGLNACGAVYDVARDRMLVHGGINNSSTAQASVHALELSTSTWSLVSTTSYLPLPGRFAHVALLDPSHDRLLVHGGRSQASFSDPIVANSDTWALDLATVPGTWQKLNSAAVLYPKGITRSGFVDFDGSRMVLLSSSEPDVFNLTTNTWTTPLEPEGNGPPSPSLYHSPGVFDPVSGRLYFHWSDFTRSRMFSAAATTHADWRAFPGGPIGRTGASLVLDSARHRLLLIGGASSDVWIFDINSGLWELLATTGLPFPISDAACAYDPAADRVLLYGGDTGSGLNLDVWQLSLATRAWSKALMRGKRPRDSRRGESFTLEPLANRILMHGGVDAVGTLLSDTWELRLGNRLSWQLLATTGAPLEARTNHSAMLDEARSRLLVFAGESSTGTTSSVRALSLATLEWSVLGPAGPTPGPRTDAAATFDAAHDQVLVFAGHTGFGEIGGVGQYWSLSFAPPAPAAFSSPGPAPATTPRPHRERQSFSVRSVTASAAEGVRFDFVSEQATEIRAELFDILGRRLAASRLQVRASSAEVVRLSVRERLAPGVYALIVRTENDSIVRRIVILR